MMTAISHRFVLAIALVVGALALSGCSTVRWPWTAQKVRPIGNIVRDRPSAATVDYPDLHWAYTIEGTSLLRPQQVFAFRGATYLQMRPGQNMPVVIADGKVVRVDVFPPYLVVRGMPSRIDLLSDGYRVIILKRS
jgi:uncharacterized protein YceK